MTARVEMVGWRFGRWTVLSYIGERKWRCRCDCGGEKSVDGRSLRRGTSTGCMDCHPAHDGIRRTHGDSGSRLYVIWRGMIARCENPKEPAFKRYGARGIAICNEWRAHFEEFRNWALLNGYAAHLTIDRRDNDLGYSPDNCRWSTYIEQNRNRRNHHPVTFGGETLLISELAERYGLPADVVKNRIRRYGWTIEKAISTPVGRHGGPVSMRNIDHQEREHA